MHTQVIEKNSNTSSSEQKREYPYLSFIWYTLGLPVVLFIPARIAFGNYSIEGGAVMIALCGLVYLATLVNRYKTKYYRSYRAIGLSAFYITLGFILSIAILAGLRLFYSRTFLLVSYLACIGWYGAGMVMFHKAPLRLLVINGGFADALHTYSKESWEFVSGLKKSANLRHFDRIAVDLHAHNNTELLSKLADSSLHGVPMIHAASVYEQFSGRTPINYITENGLYKRPYSQFYGYVKRAIDIISVVLIGILTLPVMAVTALIIKLESRGPVIFTQQRVGKGGEPFILYKFRSMRNDSEEEGAQFAAQNDVRISTFGKFIRKFRIDELPQLWNVLKGEMSIIGPRPEQPEFVRYFNEEIPFYACRHKLRPGITGWAQIKDGYAAGVESTRRKLEHDLYYFKNISLSLDLLIIYATIKTIITGFGSR